MSGVAQESVDPTAVIGRRMLAHCIDFALLLLFLFVLLRPNVAIHENVSSDFCGAYPNQECTVVSGNAFVFPKNLQTQASFVLFGYWTVMGVIEGVTGAFFGKRILRLRVVADEGGRAGPMRGALRGAMMFIDSSLCFLIGFVVVMVTHPHRRIGDRWARTLVVSADVPTLSHAIDPITWDELRGVYVYRDPVSGVRQIWDPATKQWMPLD